MKELRFRQAPPRVLPMGAPPVRPDVADREVSIEGGRIAPLADRRSEDNDEALPRGRARTHEESSWLRYLMQVHLTWLD